MKQLKLKTLNFFLGFEGGITETYGLIHGADKVISALFRVDFILKINVTQGFRMSH